jgi:hypothetical protein
MLAGAADIAREIFSSTDSSSSANTWVKPIRKKIDDSTVGSAKCDFVVNAIGLSLSMMNANANQIRISFIRR